MFANINDLVPTFLRNRPRHFVAHCMKRFLPAVSDMGDITEQMPGTFRVVISDMSYVVVLSPSAHGLPSCSCADWDRFCLPCKHMLAVLRRVHMCSCESLPYRYCSFPQFVLDDTLVGQRVDRDGENNTTQFYDYDTHSAVTDDDVRTASESNTDEKLQKVAVFCPPTTFCRVGKDLHYHKHSFLGRIIDYAPSCIHSNVMLSQHVQPVFLGTLEGELLKDTLT